ncbi:MAG: hypothetical protein WA091_03565 [Minisyncoccales bacterium]|jgi:hypothetical protein
MSADNFISISKSTFEVRYGCASVPQETDLIGRGKNLEDAVKIYEEWYKKENEDGGIMFCLEYGVIFVE